MPTRSKLLLLAALYFSQGLPYGFFTQALPVLMREQGATLQAIGLSSLLALPWAAKVLWAPLVDRYGSRRFGHRRTWLLPLQVLTVLGLVALAFAPMGDGLGLLMAGVLLTNTLAATQDIATDGLAVDLLAPNERALGNGIQVGAYRVGMIIGGGALAIVFASLGQRGVFLLMAALVAAATLPVLRLIEPAREPHTTRIPWAAYLAPVRTRAMLPWLVALAVYKGADAMATAMIRPMLVDLGASLEDIGWMLGTVGFAAGLVGALVGGLAAQTHGHAKAIRVFCLVQALIGALYALPAMHVTPFDTMPALYALAVLEYLASGMATVSLFTAMMSVCRPNAAATDYTAQASLVVIASVVGASASGWLAAQVGYALHFVVAAGLGLAAWAALLVFTPGDGRGARSEIHRP